MSSVPADEVMAGPAKSPYIRVGGLVWFARMLEKIRLHARESMQADYLPYLGKGFDGRCVRFLNVQYERLVARVLDGGSDEEILEWCFQQGRRPSEEEILIWNEFMIKRGWRDSDEPPDALQRYKERYGHADRADIRTYFDFFEVDEGRRN